uniref:Uncharacterized protein n=1 Tax=mine drainage metagenome TaxID=410659 RepID=E6Q092_9ZZZZ
MSDTKKPAKDGSLVLEEVAGELYHIGSMLLGDGEETIRLIERAVATAEIPSCCDGDQAMHSARVALAAASIELLEDRDPSTLAAPKGDFGLPNCIGDDDLSAAGVTAAELETMLAGPGRQRLRGWLEELPVVERVIFVLRAVAGLSTPEVAGLLALHGGKAAQGWMPEAVSNLFRQALCSLASQLLLDSAHR